MGRHGYSLLEVMVAVGLLSIIASIGAPNAASFLRRYRLSSTSDELAFDITRARMRAVGQSVFIRIRFEEGRRYWLERSTNGVTFSQDGPTIEFPDGVTASGDQGPTFNRRGLALATTTVVLTNGAGSKSLRTSLIGKVSVS